MTTEPANLLIAVLCLVSLVLAGGFTQTLVPEDGKAQFTIQAQGFECPPDRIIRPCVPGGGSGVERVQLIEPFLRDLIEITGNRSRPASAESTSESSPSDSPSTGTATQSSGTSTATGPGGQATQAGSGSPAPPTTDGAGAGVGLGAGFDWLLWPLLALIGTVVGVGVALGLRNSSIESARDLLSVPGYALDLLLSLLVRFAARIADAAREQWAVFVELVLAATAPGSIEPGRTFRGRIPGGRRLLAGLIALPVTLLGRVLGGDAGVEASGSEGPGRPSAVRPPDLGAGEFDIGRAWSWVARRTANRVAGPRTPDDIARDAVASGYPRQAVLDLLAAFRDVTYGGFPATGDRLETARRAYETLRDADASAPGGGE